MSEKVFIDQLVENTHIRSIFLVADLALRETKSGKPFLALSLQDRSGTVDAKVWDNAEAIAARFEVNDFVRVEAQVDSWQAQLQLNIRDAQKVDEAAVDPEDFVPTSRWPRADLLDQLRALLDAEIKSSEMRRLFDILLGDQALMQRFISAPAAKGNHHAFLGGLLEHSLSMARVAVSLGAHYQNYYPGLLNKDLLIAGCIFHDIGKCLELTYARAFDYSEEGQFVGHIVQGVEILTALAARAEPALPDDMILQLKHLILSHHGKKEFGSPVLPKTPEAILLHEIDMIDSRMNMLANIASEPRAGAADDSGWTGYQRLFQERIYLESTATRQAEWVWQDASAQAPVGPGLAAGAPAAHAQSAAGRHAVERAEAAPARQSPRSAAGAPAEVAPNLDLFRTD